jgi:hypothetical protein
MNVKVDVACRTSKSNLENTLTANKSTAFHIYLDKILFTRNVR